MKQKFVAFLSLALTFSAFAADDAAKQEEKMRAMKEYGTPGENHLKLAAMVGNWKYTSIWRESADAKAQESSGTSKMKMIMDGRFLQQDVKGTAMNKPFNGMGMIGYNNLRKQFETSWLDNMATGMVHGTGTFDKNKEIISESGEFSCPADTSGKPTPYRAEWKMEGKDKQTYTMWTKDVTTGKEYISMEMFYTRTK